MTRRIALLADCGEQRGLILQPAFIFRDHFVAIAVVAVGSYESALELHRCTYSIGPSSRAWQVLRFFSYSACTHFRRDEI